MDYDTKRYFKCLLWSILEILTFRFNTVLKKFLTFACYLISLSSDLKSNINALSEDISIFQPEISSELAELTKLRKYSNI